jgi:hypothetical protein
MLVVVASISLHWARVLEGANGGSEKAQQLAEDLPALLARANL